VSGPASQSGEKAMLSEKDVRMVAKLARLALHDNQVQQYRAQLSGVLAYMDRLREVDVCGVEPMSHPNDMANRLDADEPRPGTLATETLMSMAPAKIEPFVRVPKVIGESGS
jgi:aspartyl-tRNA(Asn)/glutamyl-tRNA(Gln) amidotransferase subunit C